MTPRRHLLPFVALETATLLAAVGNGIAMVTLPWLVLELTGRATDAGLVAGVSALPLLVAALFSGTLVDRLGRRRTSVGSDVLSAVSVAAIPVMAALGQLSLGWIVALAALGAVFDPAGATARQAMLPEAARAARIGLERANGIHEAAFGTAFLVGPAVGGLLIALVGAQRTLWATALGFALAAVVVATVRMPGGGRPAPGRSGGAGFWADTAEGLRFVWHDPALRALALLFTALVAVWLPVEGVVLPVLFQQQGSPGRLGLVLTAMSGGSVVGSLLYGVVGHRVPRRPAVLVALVGTSLPVVGMALGPPFGWLVVLGFVSGLLFGPVNPVVNVVLVQRAPERLRGRAIGVITSMAYAAGPVGLLVTGPLVDAVGVDTAFLALALGLVGVGVAAVALPGLHSLDDTPRPRVTVQ